MSTSDETDAAPSAEVIPLRPAASKKASELKWGKAVMDLGFSIVPSLLLRAQPRLGLNPTQLAVLVHLADYWWGRWAEALPEQEAPGGPAQARSSAGSALRRRT